MPRKKRKAFGKKAALKRAAVTVDSTFYFPQNTVDNSRSSSKHIQKWSIESGMIDPLLPGKYPSMHPSQITTADLPPSLQAHRCNSWP